MDRKLARVAQLSVKPDRVGLVSSRPYAVFWTGILSLVD